MAILASENWTGANGTAWPSQWTVTVPSGYTASATTQSGGGQLSITTNYGSMNAVIASMPTATNMDVLLTVNRPTNASHIAIWLCASGNLTNLGSPAPYTGYVLDLYGNSNIFYGTDMASYTAGNLTTDFQDYLDISNMSLTDTINVRFDRTGSMLSYRLWLSSLPEPTAWTYSYPDPSPLPAGVAGLGFNNDAATPPAIIVDNMIVTSDATLGWIRV